MILDKAHALDTHGAAAGEQAPQLDSLAILAEVAPLMSVQGIQPSPFFHYRDHSQDVDQDPLYPLVPPGRVPNFPAKIHAILSRSDLQHVIAWLPHGRSWQVLKPRDFESQVIPQYFDHTHYSSFVRQANGWGFRRITQGQSQNSYYHPMFLRGLPHLAKKMKRHCTKGRNKKALVESKHEPDLCKISELYPLPEKAADDSIMLQCTMQGGPRARMPVYTRSPLAQQCLAPAATIQVSQLNSALMVQGAGPDRIAEIGEMVPIANDAGVITFPTAAPPLSQVQGITGLKAEQSMAMMPIPMNPAFVLQNPILQLLSMVHQPGNPGFACASSSQFAAGFAVAMAQGQQYFSTMLQSNIQAIHSATYAP